MATLTVTHTETLTLGDGDGTERGTTNVQTITVDQVDSRIVGVPTLGLSFLSFGTMPAAGTFQYSKVKYLRITNIDPTNFVTLGIKKSDSEYFVKLYPEASDLGYNSFYLGDPVMDANEETGSGLGAFTLANIHDITIKADTATAKVELFVASID